jgi:hypothetical protein
MRQAVPVTYAYNASAFGETRAELEERARQEAEEYFATTELKLVGGGVTSERNRDRTSPKYEGTLSFELMEGERGDGPDPLE